MPQLDIRATLDETITLDRRVLKAILTVVLNQLNVLRAKAGLPAITMADALAALKAALRE